LTTVTVTSKGQVTLRKDLLRHLGVEPEQRIEARELPGGESRSRRRGLPAMSPPSSAFSPASRKKSPRSKRSTRRRPAAGPKGIEDHRRHERARARAFADGVIAFEGQRPGGETFVSFDKQAVALVSRLGSKARLL